MMSWGLEESSKRSMARGVGRSPAGHGHQGPGRGPLVRGLVRQALQGGHGAILQGSMGTSVATWA